MIEIRGTFQAHGRRFAIVAAAFNEMVVSRLVEGALACFHGHGIAEDDLLVAWVPGSFEIPVAARRLARSSGERPHTSTTSPESALEASKK